MRKPDGQYSIPADHGAISRFVEPLPIRKVPGIGKVRTATPGLVKTSFPYPSRLVIENIEKSAISVLPPLCASIGHQIDPVMLNWQ